MWKQFWQPKARIAEILIPNDIEIIIKRQLQTTRNLKKNTDGYFQTDWYFLPTGHIQ